MQRICQIICLNHAYQCKPTKLESVPCNCVYLPILSKCMFFNKPTLLNTHNVGCSPLSRASLINLTLTHNYSQKPPPDQDGANKKKFSQIGPAVLEEIARK